MPSFTVYKGSPNGTIVKAQTTRPPLLDDQVFIRVTASGLCGTDEHFKAVDMALGHQGVGIVEEMGPNVKELKKGDHVGWGYQHACCGYCDPCRTGNETYCPKRELYGEASLDQGSFASHAVWREAFVFPLPNALADEEAAPLMCAGATVFNVLYTYGVKSANCVGVVGMGALGHLAIQYAAKMGCNVVVFSSSDDKRSQAMQLGATEFITMGGNSTVNVRCPVDALLVTTPVLPEWAHLLPALNTNATIFPLAVSPREFRISQMTLNGKGIAVQGSVIAPRLVLKKMLEFSARHGIKPTTMLFPMTESGIEDAMSTLRDGRMRYCGVLKAQ
jgi:D-arabinose 1-dehydrogenase-like Zn-dependent alcohol dehydrogenase